MAKSTPTQYAFFVRHKEEGRGLNRPFHVIGRHVGEDALRKPKEETLFDVLVNQIPSFFFVDKDKFPPIAANEEIVFTAYVTNEKNYVCMVCTDRQRLSQTTECLTLKVSGKKFIFHFSVEVNLIISDCDEHTPEYMRRK
jgi:hypothetical protein